MSFIEKSDKVAFYCLCGYGVFCSVSIAVSNIFISLAALSIMINIASNKNNIHIIRIPKVYLRALIVFFGSMFILIFFSDDLSDAIQRFLKFSLKLIPLLLAVAVLKERQQIIKIMLCIVISITIADVFAIWQGFQGNFRAPAFFPNPMYLAGILVQLLPILFLISFNMEGKRNKYLIMAFIIGCIAMLFNGTRGAWGSLLITICMVIFMYGKNIRIIVTYGSIVFVFLAVIFFAVPALNSRIDTMLDMKYQSNSERILMWQSAGNMLQDHPLIGVGLGRYEYYYQNQYILPEAKERRQGHAHNNFIHLAAETGIIGLSSFSFMFGSFLFYSLKDWLKMHRASSLMFFSATCGLLLQGLTETNFGNSIVMNLYYFLMGLYIQFNYLEKKN
ncbi:MULTISPECIES: O-antigen ligase family protein [Pelosinus]|uniref:O-antigen ligase-related domain-containing protein n=1 Tax=Pelosinus fermentans B4 TaxID=1149862 RepID=I8RAQ3_9FIRM|nr:MULTISPECIES: O-antigen ligase family protein [Pelosinus]EIW16013.1 hypothetical protein FB4_1702 [Pelosinus fermentans B4]EIW27281.1 O-antigen polymerase [Pelosinus fermentans A11]